MPAKSKAQQRFMAGVATGNIPAPEGLDKKTAEEYMVAGKKNMPERVAKKPAPKPMMKPAPKAAPHK